MRLLLIIVGVLVAVASYGQGKDKERKSKNRKTLQERFEAVTDSVKDASATPQGSDQLVVLDKIDSVKDKRVDQIDSLNSGLETISEKANKKLQILNNIVASPGDSLDAALSTPGKLFTGSDTVERKVEGAYDKAQKRLDQAQEGITGRVDSVQTIVQDKINKLESKIENKIKDKTKEDINLPDAGMNLPTTELQTDLPLPDLDKNIPGIDASMPELDLPTVNTGISDVKIDKIPTINTDVKILSDSGKLNISAIKELPGAEKVDGLTDGVEEVDKLKNEVDKLKDSRLQDVETDALEERVSEFTEVGEVSAQAQKMKELQAQQEALLQRYKDKKLLQDEIVRKSANVKNDIINKNAQAFKDAQAEIAKMRKLNASVQSAKGMKLKRSNQMKGKPLRERLQPGATLQSYRSDIFQMEVGLQVGYRLAGRWTVGVAGVHRLGFSEKFDFLVESQHIYGYRGFADFKAIKSFYAHAEYERLRHPAVSNILVSENSFDHTSSIALGIGKRFTISKRWNGSMLGLYRIQTQNIIPGVNKFGVRMGFSLNMKKQVK